MLRDASYYAQMAIGLAQYQLSRRTADPVEALRDQMRHREERFLTLARSVLEQPAHVYRTLFDLAGCSYTDLERSVRTDGLRHTLARLLAAGVYITHEEFTGRAEMVRAGRHIAWNPRELDNPAGRGRNTQSTSGSTGPRLTTAVNNRMLLYREAHETLEIRNLGLDRRARVLVGAVLPSSWPIRRQVTWGRLGVPVDCWFAPGASRAYRVATAALVTEIGMLGARAMQPAYLPPNDFTPVAETLARVRAEGRPAYVRTMVSMATRSASAALERGLDLRGTVFSVSGETLTAPKRTLLERTGATVIPLYGATEFGTFGYACPHLGGDAVHLFDDALLLVSHRLPDRSWESLFVTNQLPWGPRILINVGIDDCATLEACRCDCEYQRAGFTMQARNIASYGKVTTQGVTMNAADLAPLVESVLPARFGGAPGDYQLVEVDGAAQSEMQLRVSPRCAVPDREVVREFVLTWLREVHGGSLSERLWEFTRGLTVVEQEPEVTQTGKVHPLRLRRDRASPTS